jgi:hypothetical protein
MPSHTLIAAFRAARDRHAARVADLIPLLIEMALMTVAEVLPGAKALETEGEMNEDWIFTLRVQRVLDRNGTALYDVAAGDADPAVEETTDEVGFEYLDLLLDLTGDQYLGRRRVERTPGAAA